MIKEDSLNGIYFYVLIFNIMFWFWDLRIEDKMVLYYLDNLLIDVDLLFCLII